MKLYNANKIEKLFHFQALRVDFTKKQKTKKKLCGLRLGLVSFFFFSLFGKNNTIELAS